MNALLTEGWNMPQGWEWSTIGFLTENHDRRRIPVRAADRAAMQGPYPYYGASGVIDWVDDYLFDGEYLLITEDGNLLAGTNRIAFLAKGKFWVNNHAHVVQTFGDVPLGYLKAYLNCLNLTEYVTGTTRPKLTQTALNRIPIPVPPHSEQQRIVAEIERQFTRLDATIEGLERVRVNLERYRASVLRAACEGRLVENEADVAGAEGRQYEHADDLLERILSKRRTNWESQPNGRRKYKEAIEPDDYGLPPLPEGWVWGTIDQLSLRVQYGTSRRANSDETGTPVLRMGNVQNGKLDFSDLKYLPPESSYVQETLLSEGDLLFNRTNSAELVGKSAVFKKGYPESCFASYLIRVTFSQECSPDFFCAYINSQQGRKYISRVRSQQVGQANVNATKLKAMPVPIPPLAEQERIVDEINIRTTILETVESAVDESLRRAKWLRQSISIQAIRGSLVSQHPDDEPASELLERIRVERDDS